MHFSSSHTSDKNSACRFLYVKDNHLGNIMATVSDRKIAVANNSTCKTCQDIKTVYDAYVLSNGALTAANTAAFTSYANSALSLWATSADYMQALKECRLITNSLNFDGIGYTSSSAASALSLGTGNASIETWFKTDYSSNYKALIDNLDWTAGALRGLQVCIYQGKLYAVFFEGTSVNQWSVYTNNPIPLNQWAHMVITKTGYNPAAYAIYINGVSVAVTYSTQTGSGAAGMTTGKPLTIGTNIYAGLASNKYTGRLRNMKVYSKALSPAEIATNYNGGCITDNTVTSNLLFYAKLNEGSGPTAYDYSGASLSSSLSLASWTVDGMPGSSCLSPAELAQPLCYLSTVEYFTGEVLSASDYYAFGATMPGRNFSANSYRYGFNGKENDPESGTQDYGMRIYNPSLGKFLSTDPLSKNYPWNSTYAFAENRPIDGIDLDGEEFLSPLMDIADKVIPVLESGNSNKTLVYSMKVWRGMANSTLEGNLRGVVNEMKYTYSMSQKVLKDPNSAESRQFVKELIKHPETKALEGLYHTAKGALQGDPDDIGFVAGTVLQMGITKVAMPKGSTAPLDASKTVKNIEYGTDFFTRNASSHTEPVKGAYNVFAHSDAGWDYFKVDGEQLSAQQLYDNMLKDGYKPGSPINLYSCGSASNGLAQQISNLSKADVLAPTGKIYPALKDVSLPKGTTGKAGSKVVPFTPQ